VISNARMAESSSTTRMRLSLVPTGSHRASSLPSGPYSEVIALIGAQPLRCVAFGEELHYLAVERREVVRLAAAHPIPVADALLIAPRRTGVLQVVPQSRPARDGVTLHQLCRNQQPRSVADDGHRLA